MNIDAYGFLLQYGGVARRRDLERRGVSGIRLAALVHAGVLVRPRIGWYCLPDVDGRVIEAVRVGGVVTCISAAAKDGLWVLDDERLHICVRPTGSLFRSRTDAAEYPSASERQDVVLHWDQTVWAQSGGYVVARIDYLAHVVRCRPAAEAVSVLDSALHSGLLSTTDLGKLRAIVPAVHRKTVDLVDGRAESGVESHARLGFLDAGILFDIQVEVARDLRVDFVLEGILVVEVDGSAHHSGHRAFTSDRERDAYLNVLGYRVLHFTYAMVIFDWPTVLSTVQIVLRQERSRRAATAKPGRRHG